jgi:hypothetical protein
MGRLPQHTGARIAALLAGAAIGLALAPAATAAPTHAERLLASDDRQRLSPWAPLDVPIGSRWSLTVHGNAALRGSQPTSQLTYRSGGLAASLSRGPDAAMLDIPWFHRHGLAGTTAEDPHDLHLAGRRHLRNALAQWLRSGGTLPGALEVGTDVAAWLPGDRLPAFPQGSGFSRGLGLDLISLRIDSAGGGHARLGRRLGPDLFVTLEPGIGGSEDRARLQYRLNDWMEVRVTAGRTQAVEMVAAIPIR